MTTETTTPAGKIAEIVDLERFKVYQTGLYGDSFAIGTDTSLIINSIHLPNTNGNDNNYNSQEGNELNNSSTENNNEAFNERLKFTEFPDTSSRISSLLWLTEDVICIGFESGLLLGYSIPHDEKPTTSNSDNKITELFQFKGGNSIISSLRLFEDRGVRKLWILYEEGLLLMVSSDIFFFQFPFHI